MINIKTPEEIAILREGGRRHAYILAEISKKIAPGVSTNYLEEYAKKLIKEGGDSAAFLNYTPRGAKWPYPASQRTSYYTLWVFGLLK